MVSATAPARGIPAGAIVRCPNCAERAWDKVQTDAPRAVIWRGITNMALNGRVALVAGASRGIGADIAKYLAAAGAKVVVAARTEVQQDPRLPGTIHSVVEEIKARGGEASPVVLNLRDGESIANAVKATVAQYGKIDIVVNNAAIFVPGTLETVQSRHIDLSFSVNVMGVILMMREVYPHLRAAGGGHIVNISSGGAIFPGPGPYDTTKVRSGDIFYGPQKSLIEHFSQSEGWRNQVDGISVNVLSPSGRIKTPGNLMASNDRENPNLDFDIADDMGKATVWICEQPATVLNGAILYDSEVVQSKGL
ncbi:MAG: SDR family NAD(P)-dependent oxidoreductase [Chloroflexi bacterium]|nr:MAG: SDR family NAD(P)-dependent oxidoreductase [Chloroflexota bacterium]